MLRLMMLLSACSLVVGCSQVKRPNSNACWVNAPGGYKRCYNLASDYDKNGIRLPGAKAKDIPITSLKDLNGALTFDAASQKELKRFMDESRREYNDLKEQCGL